MGAAYCRNCSRMVNGSRDPYCAACRPREIVTKIRPQDALEGEWVLDPVRRIMVHREPPKLVKPSPIKHERTLTCPKCGADYGEPCRSAAGGVTDTHMDRLEAVGLPPTCLQCGAERERKKKFCDACRTERRLAAWRRNQAKSRARRAA